MACNESFELLNGVFSTSQAPSLQMRLGRQLATTTTSTRCIYFDCTLVHWNISNKTDPQIPPAIAQMLQKITFANWKREAVYCSLLLVLLLVSSYFLTVSFMDFIVDVITNIQQNYNYYYNYYLYLYSYTLFYCICKLIFVPEVFLFSE